MGTLRFGDSRGPKESDVTHQYLLYIFALNLVILNSQLICFVNGNCFIFLFCLELPFLVLTSKNMLKDMLWSASCPLKTESTSWKSALQELLLSLPHDKLKIINHMQEQWECRLAADDFTKEYKARQANFNASNNVSAQFDEIGELGRDLDWQLGQLDQAVGPEFNPDITTTTTDFDEFFEEGGKRTQLATELAIALAGAANFYKVSAPPNNIHDLLAGCAIQSHDASAHIKSQAAALLIAEEKALAISNRVQLKGTTIICDLYHNPNFFFRSSAYFK
ncbi:hypothetical protein B0H10DRAFT_1945446 [Mycena sp. CBHHK59/15]|nr:hypothetical protein B0H10DRAFT_1945446 [Mycena sp. CBHHK59/15]